MLFCLQWARQNGIMDPFEESGGIFNGEMHVRTLSPFSNDEFQGIRFSMIPFVRALPLLVIQNHTNLFRIYNYYYSESILLLKRGLPDICVCPQYLEGISSRHKQVVRNERERNHPIQAAKLPLFCNSSATTYHTKIARSFFVISLLPYLQAWPERTEFILFTVSLFREKLQLSGLTSALPCYPPFFVLLKTIWNVLG